MPDLTVAMSIVGVFGTLSSITFAYLAFFRKSKCDSKENGKNETLLTSDIKYIKSSVDRVERTLEKLEEKYDDLQIRVIKVEQRFDDHLQKHNLSIKELFKD